jgi:hypothetical protein
MHAAVFLDLPLTTHIQVRLSETKQGATTMHTFLSTPLGEIGQ